MRKCNMGSPRVVMKAVLLSMPVISIFFLSWLGFLGGCYYFYYVCVCVSFLLRKQVNIGHGVRDFAFSWESELKLNDSSFG